RAYEPSPLSVALLAEGQHAEEGGRDGEVYRVAAAALDYHPREAKSVWEGHYQRYREPVSLWEQTRDVLRVDAELSEVTQDWAVAEGRRVLSRTITLRGELAPGSTIGVGARPFALYEMPVPFDTETPARVVHAPHEVEVVEVLDYALVV